MELGKGMTSMLRRGVTVAPRGRSLCQVNAVKAVSE